MKYLLGLIATVGIIVTLMLVIPFGQNGTNEEYLRIHIRANSNLEMDQNIKYMVKDKVVDAMIPFLSEAKTKQEAEKKIKENFDFIERVANEVLRANGFSYVAHAKLAREEFPTRQYDNLTLESGYYDALILELGKAEGNNWWCVVYPPFCFLQTNNQSNVVYVSKIWEIIKNIIN